MGYGYSVKVDWTADSGGAGRAGAMALTAAVLDEAPRFDQDVLERLRSLLDELGELSPQSLGDADSIRSLSRSFARLDATYTRAMGSFDAEGDWAGAGAGAHGAGAWLAVEAHLPVGEARRRVNLARRLRDLPVSEAAWVRGEINAAHVIRLAGVYRESTAAAMARDESILVDKAMEFRYDHFSRVVAYWEGLADPDGTDDKAEAKRARRDVYLTKTFDDMYLGRMCLDPISGSIVATEHERLERILFEADWAEAKARLGRNPLVDELSRTPAQRRADALVEMAMRSRTAPANGIRPAPLFTVMVGYETLHGRVCELANGSVMAPGALLPWLDQAHIERAVFSPKGRVEVSARARLFSGATLRALQIRDRHGCGHPYCFAPAWRCQADHIQPYHEGGATTQENGRMACGPHNRDRNHHPDVDGWRDGRSAPGDVEDRFEDDPDPPLRD